MISEKTEEILEELWIKIIENKQKSVKKNDLNLNVKELVDLKLINIDSNEVKLTEEGKKEAEDVVRRHRLAERLLVDILDVKGGLVHESACQFEHHLHRGIDENICRLLGHPKICPHGSRIPPGKCCREKKTYKDIRVISPLAQVKVGEEGKIAYIQADDQSKLRTIMAMGILPGMEIKLIQNFPSYLFNVGHSQFAVDENIANEIFVRIVTK
ncbi:MAG: metal-dependent transcriptional regulator [Candidatus Firestonebacteria bacterium]